MSKFKTQLIKVSALAIAALLSLTACGAPDSDGVPEGGDSSEKIPVTGEADGQGGSASGDMTVTDFNYESSTNAAGVITYKLSWKAGGKDYESAFTGVKSELSEEQLKNIADKSTASEVAELRADGAENKFTDAEKTSRLLPDGSGQPVEPTDFQKLDHWGETQLCWAASLSNILWNTGWAAKAVNPTTGEAFKSEDELFQFYALNFRDDGAEASEGARWFFTGTYYRAGGSDTRNGNMEKGLVDGVDFEKVCTPSQDITKGEFITSELLIPVVKKISEGAGVEFDLSLDRYTHPPKSDPYGTLLIDDAKNAYYSADEPVVFTEEEALKLTQFYTYAEDGRIIALKQEGGSYTDDKGTAYPASVVWKGEILWDEESQSYKGLKKYTKEANEYYEYAPEGYEGDAIWMTLKKTGYVDESEVDMATTVKTHCGKHAVTCCGYVTCKDASGKETLVSLFIADSDSDANIYTTVKEADSDVKRPDVISAFPLEISDEEFGNTCLLKGYSDILIATISELTLINGPEK